MCSSTGVTRVIIPPGVAQQIICQISHIYLRKCPCRVSVKRCPTDGWEVCLLLDHASGKEIMEGHRIVQQEALSMIHRMAQQQVIFNLFFHAETGEITELCSCCTCCCKPLRRLKKSGNYAGEVRFGYAAVTDERFCDGCGACLDSCYFQARRSKDGAISLKKEQCFGCGRCIGDCPREAIRLEMDPLQSHPICAPVIEGYRLAW